MKRGRTGRLGLERDKTLVVCVCMCVHVHVPCAPVYVRTNASDVVSGDAFDRPSKQC